MASGRMNTFEEGILKVARDLTDIQSSPGITPEQMKWCIEKQTEFIAKAREPADLANPNPPLPTGPSNDMAPPGPPPPELAALLGGGGGIPGAPPGMGAGPPGRGPMPAPPRPGPTDMGEIARMLG